MDLRNAGDEARRRLAHALLHGGQGRLHGLLGCAGSSFIRAGNALAGETAALPDSQCAVRRIPACALLDRCPRKHPLLHTRYPHCSGGLYFIGYLLLAGSPVAVLGKLLAGWLPWSW